VTIDNADGEIWSGGGGGAGFLVAGYGGNGGGGAGYLPGATPIGQQQATPEAGGLGSSGGNGGGPGQNGQPSAYGDTGGSKGVAIDGDSFITWVNEGDIRGTRIN
jgi:hypothetical protein